MTTHSPATATTALLELIWPGALAAQAIHTAARLGLADLVADGPRSADDLAAAAGADGPGVARLLRALASLNIFCEQDDGRFGQTPLSATLRRGLPAHAWAVMLGAPFVWRPWGRLHDCVVHGACAFDDEFGMPFARYMAAHPDQAAAYDTAMDANATVAGSAVVAAYDFAPCTTIVDVGGGRGALLAAILDATPAARGVLFDLPAVVADPAQLQVTRLAARCAVEGGDFFDRVPAGDALVLKSIIHGFDDDHARRILDNCRRALTPGGRLLLVETVLEPRHQPGPQKAMMDLMMFTLTTGHERTAAQFETLLAAAQFELRRIIPTERGNAVIEATPR